MHKAPQNVVILAGGIGLGAYQAGAYAELHAQEMRPNWVAGSSIGAINGAIIAGNSPGDRISRLGKLWTPDPRSGLNSGVFRRFGVKITFKIWRVPFVFFSVAPWVNSDPKWLCRGNSSEAFTTSHL